jgi:autoinducer 2-degrading protein
MDAAAHKQTAHYLNWRDSVADMMAEPRKGVSYAGLYPA